MIQDRNFAVPALMPPRNPQLFPAADKPANKPAGGRRLFLWSVNFWWVAVAICVSLSGCAGIQPRPYSGLLSSSKLQPNQADRSGRVPYSFSVPVEWRRYDKAIIEPVAIYRGPDNQLEKISESDKQRLADYMGRQFRDKLASVFQIVDKPQPGAVRIRLTLTGAKPTTAVLATLTRFDLSGGLYNTVQTVRGKEGAMTGSVMYAVEIQDASSDVLLDAYVTKQYPSAMNIGASFGAMGAAMTGVRKGAQELAERLRRDRL